MNNNEQPSIENENIDESEPILTKAEKLASLRDRIQEIKEGFTSEERGNEITDKSYEEALANIDWEIKEVERAIEEELPLISLEKETLLAEEFASLRERRRDALGGFTPEEHEEGPGESVTEALTKIDQKIEEILEEVNVKKRSALLKEPA